RSSSCLLLLNFCLCKFFYACLSQVFFNTFFIVFSKNFSSFFTLFSSFTLLLDTLLPFLIMKIFASLTTVFPFWDDMFFFFVTIIPPYPSFLLFFYYLLII